MTLHKLTQDDLEVFTIQTNPKQTFVSNSSGTTGGVYVYSRRPAYEKDLRPYSFYSASYFVDEDIDDILRNAKRLAIASGSNTTAIREYMTTVHSLENSRRLNEQMEVYRYVPGVTLSKDFNAKRSITNTLMPFYRTTYQTAHFNYTNYNCLNFFSASTETDNSVLLYPQVVTGSSTLSGSYIFQDAFSFDFWIKPKYSTESGAYKTGTIFHLSGAYAVSLVSGSSRDVAGNVDKFRILVQLSSSANTPPSNINVSSLPTLCFITDDNVLPRDEWSHVTVRWGSNAYNLGSGSFIVNNSTKGTFNIPSSSVAPQANSPYDNPTVLCVGNYYNGVNSGSSVQARFFSTDISEREGLIELVSVSGVTEPASYSFTNPLRAEIHELKIYNRYLSNTEIEQMASGSTAAVLSGTLFYLPPFFSRESPTRQYYAGNGGILTTPFTSKTGTTITPFSTELSSEVGGHYINLENFTRDFATGKYPRLFALSASVVTAPTTIAQTSDEIMYATGSVMKRQMTIMPCDNGKFYPSFFALTGLNTSSFRNDLGNAELGSISLREVYASSSIFYGISSDTTSSMGNNIYGPDPSIVSTLGDNTGSVPCVLQRTRDLDSNQVVMFDISNLFYGSRIKPNSFSLYDGNLSCSFGKTAMTLRDDGYGNIYRADTSSSIASWNSVGNIFYNEGMVILKNPALYFFGKNEFTVDFQGENQIHVQRFRCTTNPLEETISDNRSFTSVSSSLDANNTDSSFVYITEVLLHDDNLNVIGRMKVAQPYTKRSGDKTTFVFQNDY